MIQNMSASSESAGRSSVLLYRRTAERTREGGACSLMNSIISDSMTARWADIRSGEVWMSTVSVRAQSAGSDTYTPFLARACVMMGVNYCRNLIHTIFNIK